jgi:predicted  nucleic acid-binding Zn-ribbon protein
MPTYFDMQKLRAAQPGPQRVFGQELLRPKTDIATIESVYGGVVMTNFVAEGFEFANLNRPVSEERDFNYNPGRFFRDNPQHQWFLEITRNDEDAFEAVLGTVNESQMLAMIENQKRVMEQYAAFEADPVAGWIGAIGGAIFDLPMLLAPGAGAMVGFAKAAKTMAAARRISAARLATLGAAENIAFEAARKQRDVTVGGREFALAGALGGVVGGAIGGVFPRAGGVVFDAQLAAATRSRAGGTKRPFAREGAAEAPAETPEPKSVGAAAVAREEDLDLPFGGGSMGHAWLPFAEALRTPKQRWLNAVTDNPDDPGVAGFFREFSKMVRVETVTRGEKAGVSIRPDENWEEITRSFFGPEWLGGLYAKYQIGYAKLAENLGDGFMARASREPIFRERFDSITRYNKPGLTKGEFQKLMWRWAQHEGRGLDSENVFRHFLPKDILPNELDEVRAAVRQAANDTDDVSNRAWSQWFEDGLVDTPEPPIPFYWAQLWKREATLDDEAGAAEFLVYNQGWDPPEQWLVSEGFIQPGQFARNMDAETTARARDEWSFRQAEKIRDDAEKLLEKARKDLRAAEDEAVEAAFARTDKRVADLQERVSFWESQIDNAKTVGQRQKATAKLQKAEAELDDLATEVEEARLRMQTREGMLAELDYAARRAKGRAEREAVVAAQKKLQRAATKEEEAVEKTKAAIDESRIDPLARARNMVRNINSTLTDQENIYGFAMADYDVGRAGTSPNLHPRNIDVTRSVADFDPRLDRYMETDPERILEAYFQHMAPRDALQRAYGTQDLEEHFRPFIDKLPAHMRHDAGEDIKAILDRGLGRHLARDPDARWWSSVLRSVNVVSFLGLGSIAQASDLSILHAALGSTSMTKTIGAVVKEYFSTDKAVRRALTQMDRPQLMALIYGLEQTAAQGGRARRLFELDPEVAKRGLGRPGSAWNHLTRGTHKAAEVAADGFMEINLMQHWNRAITRLLRKAGMRQLVTWGEKGWDTIPESYQATLRSRGIGPKDIEEFQRLFKERNVELVPGLKLPDIDRWPAAARRKMERAVEIASGVGVVMPTLGDMPRWTNSPLGALFFQFTGFAYSSQNKFLRRVAQDPTATSHMQALFMALFFTTMANGARATLRGDVDEWAESWETPEGAVQNMYEMFLRGPFAVAWSGSAAELLTSQLGRPANQGLEALGLRPVVPSVSRFQERSGLGRALGPTFAQGERLLRLTREGAAAVTGGSEEWDQFQRTFRRYAPGAGLTTLYGLDAVLGEPD